VLGTLASAAGAAGGLGGGGGSSDMQSVGPVYSGGEQGNIVVNTGGEKGLNPLAVGGLVFGAVALVAGFGYLRSKA